MQDDIRISVVIPTYNRCRLVGRAIDSALAQTYSPGEIIVIDDGSGDETRAVLKKYGERIRWAYQANAGVSVARNRGVADAKNEWIAFLDADDYWRSDHLSRIVGAIQGTAGEAALYFSDVEVPGADGGGLYWSRCGFRIDGCREFRRDASEWAFLPIQPMLLQASVVSRKAFVELGGFAEQLRTREDTLLFYKFCLRYPVCAVSGCGTVMNSDDDIRLTQVYKGNSIVYAEATVFLYRNIIEDIINIDPERRKFLRARLAASYFNLSRELIRQRDYPLAINNMVVSFFTSPFVFVREVNGFLSRFFVRNIL